MTYWARRSSPDLPLVVDLRRDGPLELERAVHAISRVPALIQAPLGAGAGGAVDPDRFPLTLCLLCWWAAEGQARGAEALADGTRNPERAQFCRSRAAMWRDQLGQVAAAAAEALGVGVARR